MISNKCSYALRAVLELSKREGSGPVTIIDIAQAQHIPARFLESILRQLKQAGITESIRGKKGGYVLGRTASQISMGEVIRLMEGPHFSPETPETAPDVFADIWKQAERALNKVYDNTTFASLAEADRDRALKSAHDYVI